MTTALQRLLARPSSYGLLRQLVRTPALEQVLQRATKESCICTGHFRYQKYATAAAYLPSKEPSTVEAVVDDANDSETHPLTSTDDHQRREPVTHEPPNEPLLPRALPASGSPTAWGAYLRTYKDVGFQSDFSPQNDDTRKLVDDPRFSNNLVLWAYLLEFRKSQYGDAGVAMLWGAIQKRGLELPTTGPLADKFWPIFLQAGFGDKQMLRDVCRYADKLYDSSGKHWPKLYVYIMQNIILNGDKDTILPWHGDLIERHPPDPAAFSRLVHNILLMGGDLEALKLLYKTSFYETQNNYKIYGTIMPLLIERKDFDAAMEWHLLLVHRGDYSLNKKAIESLIHHFESYDPWKAMRLKRTLASTGMQFPDSTSHSPEEPERTSREMMNIVHGKTFGIEPKEYSDRLGARWFATNWISLDLAINAVHALGIQGIGPLSLQAIALREFDASGIIRRIDQLKELGISIGGFVFSKAVEHFARNGAIDHLEGLLRSDQHPDSYEDRQLQDRLLAAYARSEDWAQYRLTAAVRAAGSHNSSVTRYNQMQQANIFRGDRSAFFVMLEEMRIHRIPFNTITLRCIMKDFLQPRRKGHSDTRRKSIDDLLTLISILTTIMQFGSSVPPTAWREIIRRLGMLGRFDDLEKLCFWLATWYNPKSTLHSQSAGILPRFLVDENHYVVPGQVPTSHRFHPLRIVFSDMAQRAIVEWAFTHEPLRQPFQTTLGIDNLAKRSADYYTRGVRLLRELRDRGVYIEMAQIRRALWNRFAILYEPGVSRKVRNRLLKLQNVTSREDMIARLNEAWGADIWMDTRDSEWRRDQTGDRSEQ